MAARIKVIAILFLYLTVYWIRGFYKFRHSETFLRTWKYIPLYILAALGIYATISITISLCRFNNVPHAQQELLKELEEIKKELEKKNFTFT